MVAATLTSGNIAMNATNFVTISVERETASTATVKSVATGATPFTALVAQRFTRAA